MRKQFKIALASVIGLVAVSPWLLYWLALWSVQGRPTPPVPPYISKERAHKLWLCLGQPPPISIQPKSPPAMVIGFLTGQFSWLKTSGDFVAWQVARNYNYEYLAGHDKGHGHLAGTGLTIWLTRNWTADEILTAADKIILTYPSENRCLRRTGMSYD